MAEIHQKLRDDHPEMKEHDNLMKDRVRNEKFLEALNQIKVDSFAIVVGLAVENMLDDLIEWFSGCSNTLTFNSDEKVEQCETEFTQIERLEYKLGWGVALASFCTVFIVIE